MIFFIVFIFRLRMANFPDIPTESNLASEDDDALDPRVQVYYFSIIVFIIFIHFI